MIVEIITWCLIFLIPMQLSYLVLERKDINRLIRSTVSMVIFFAFSSLAFVLMPGIQENIQIQSLLIPYVACFILYIISSYIFSKYLKISLKKSEDKAPYFFNFDFPFVLTKLSDILFQQLMIFALFSMLLSYGLSEGMLVITFTALFVLIHLGVLLRHGSYGWYYVIGALFAGLRFH
jgi:hypothetical protein